MIIKLLTEHHEFKHLFGVHAQKNRLIETVLLSTHNICFEYPKHMFWMRNKENNFPIPRTGSSLFAFLTSIL